MHLLKRLFVRKQSSISGAAMILMVAVFLSGLFGLVRDRLLAETYSPEMLGLYFAAFRLPNMIFDLLVTGVLTTAFIPVFTRLLTQKGEAHAWKMASTVMNFAVIAFALLSIPVILFAKQISYLLAPGFTPQQHDVMASFTQVMIIFQVFPLLIGNFLIGMLQSYQLFLIPAFAPILYNIGTITGIYFFAPSLGLWAPVVGVILGAFLFLLVQIPALMYLRFKHEFSFDKEVEGVKEVFKLMVPRTIGLGVAQIDTTTDLALASLLGSKMVTIFNFAQHLQQVPIGLFGITVAQAALPTLSRLSVEEGKTQFRKELISAIHQILFFVLPISVLFIVLRIPITRIVFGTDKFDWEATVLTGKTLSTFSISLFAQALIQVLTRAFYALYDTRTPVKISVMGILLNAGLSFVFIYVFHFPVWGLGLSTSIAMLIQVSVLAVILQKRIGHFSFHDVVFVPGKIIFTTMIMGGILFVLQRLLDQLVFDTTRTINLFLLVGTIGGIGGSVYLFLSWVFGIGQVDQFIKQVQKLKKIRTILPLSFLTTGDQKQEQL